MLGFWHMFPHVEKAKSILFLSQDYVLIRNPSLLFLGKERDVRTIFVTILALVAM